MFSPQTTQVILIDPQTSLLNIIPNSSLLVLRIIHYIKSFKVLDIPVLITRQNPSKLGDINVDIKEEINKDNQNLFYDKTAFSCFAEKGFKSRLVKNRHQLLIMGIETSICVLQSVLQACKEGYEVTVIGDAIGGRKKYESSFAINEMQQAGASILGYDSIIYGIIEDSDSPKFKSVLALIKSYPADKIS